LLCVFLPLGCNRGPSEEELGEIHYSLPKIPGANDPFEMPPPLTRKSKSITREEARDQPEPAAGSTESPVVSPEQQTEEAKPLPVEESSSAESE
jgi:hypothetical protein